MTNSEPGIVSTNEWITAPDGSQRRAFYADKWRIVTDKEIPVMDFRSSERWSLMGYKYDEVSDMFEFAILIPGCKVAGFVVTDICPWTTDVANLSKHKRGLR